MTDYRSVLERAGSHAPSPDLDLERILRRRDRKRRNQRVAAGVVGLAVFVAVVLILGTVGLSDRTRGPAGDRESGSTETGPAETGPTVTGPIIRNTGNPSSVGFGGLPPEGATPSEPLRGALVMKDSGNSLGHWYAVNVYADGRLIWSRDVKVPGVSAGVIVPRWIEQRLTPEGVELLRSGAVPLGGEFENPAQGLPANAWEDRTLRPFVPWRYAACLNGEPPLALEFLPVEAKDLLLRSPSTDATSYGVDCREVTLEDARVLVEILSDAGFELIGDQPEEQPAGDGPGGFWMFTDPNGNQPPNVRGWGFPGIAFWIVLPHGSADG